jgi:hypothetical protein
VSELTGKLSESRTRRFVTNNEVIHWPVESTPMSSSNKIYFNITISLGAWAAQWYSAGLRAGWWGVRVRQWLLIFLFTAASRPALGLTQPPIQWVQGALSLGVKQPGREAEHSPSSISDVKECVELYRQLYLLLYISPYRFGLSKRFLYQKCVFFFFFCFFRPSLILRHS